MRREAALFENDVRPVQCAHEAACALSMPAQTLGKQQAAIMRSRHIVGDHTAALVEIPGGEQFAKQRITSVNGSLHTCCDFFLCQCALPYTDFIHASFEIAASISSNREFRIVARSKGGYCTGVGKSLFFPVQIEDQSTGLCVDASVIHHGDMNPFPDSYRTAGGVPVRIFPVANQAIHITFPCAWRIELNPDPVAIRDGFHHDVRPVLQGSRIYPGFESE